MRYLCQLKGLKELEIFASNLCEDEDELFHVSHEALEKLDKIRVYMFTMDPQAIHSLSSIVMTKVRPHLLGGLKYAVFSHLFVKSSHFRLMLTRVR